MRLLLPAVLFGVGAACVPYPSEGVQMTAPLLGRHQELPCTACHTDTTDSVFTSGSVGSCASDPTLPFVNTLSVAELVSMDFANV